MSKEFDADLSKLTEREYWSFEVMEARFALIEELIDISQPVELADKLLTHAVTTLQLESKRREMLDDYNALVEKLRKVSNHQDLGREV